MRLHLRIGFRRSERATFCDENVLLDHSALDPPTWRASLQTGLKPLDEKPGDTPCQSRPTRNLASLRLAEGPDCDVRRGACGKFCFCVGGAGTGPASRDDFVSTSIHIRSTRSNGLASSRGEFTLCWCALRFARWGNFINLLFFCFQS